jgi:hypothetical protein
MQAMLLNKIYRNYQVAKSLFCSVLVFLLFLQQSTNSTPYVSSSLLKSVNTEEESRIEKEVEGNKEGTQASIGRFKKIKKQPFPLPIKFEKVSLDDSLFFQLHFWVVPLSLLSHVYLTDFFAFLPRYIAFHSLVFYE